MKHRLIIVLAVGLFLPGNSGQADESLRRIDAALDEYEAAVRIFANESFEMERAEEVVIPGEFSVEDEVVVAQRRPSKKELKELADVTRQLDGVLSAPEDAAALDALKTLSEGEVNIEIPETSTARMIAQVEGEDNLQELSDDTVISVLELKNMDIVDVLKLISQKTGLNIIAGSAVKGKVSIYLKDVKLRDALRIILDSNNLAYKVEDGIVRVMPNKEFETRYGYAFGGQMETRILRLIYADATDMVTVLNQLKSPAGKIIFDLKSSTLVLMDTPEKLNVMGQLIGEIDVPVETEVFQLSYAPAKDVSEKLLEFLTKNVGRIKFDERSNQIVVTDTQVKIDQVAQMIEALDMKGEQVLIEAKILQITLSDQFKFGVDWQAIVRDYHDVDLVADFNVLSSNDKRGTVSIGTIDRDDYTAVLEILESVGYTNILSSPRITAMNNQEAKILVGETQAYVTSTTTTPSSGPTTTAESVNFIDVGVKLFVTPTIHRDDFITMKIKPEVSSVTGTLTTSNENVIPIVGTSEAETTVMVKNGITIVIGGLIKEEKLDSFNKIPLLGDIPLLGNVFQNRDETIKKTEIVIFLTPTIISGDVADDESLYSKFDSTIPEAGFLIDY